MRKILSTRGDHVARKLSIAGIIAPLGFAEPSPRDHDAPSTNYNFARGAQGIGHVTAAPPSAASNSRRPMVTVIRPSRARCVKERYHATNVLS